LPEVRRILAENALALFRFQIASAQQDMKQATDMLLRTGGSLAIAIRLRRADYPYRDLTIRAARANGAMTELEKIQAGNGDFYLYGWTRENRIAEWMLVNLHQLRASGLLTQYHPIRNRDGATAFIAIPHAVLSEHRCVVSKHILQSERKLA
jgi:hypothetical protein